MIRYNKVICVGTIWDLDDVAYPETDDFSRISIWNYNQVMQHQLDVSRDTGYQGKKIPVISRNDYGIKVKTCCASCAFKEYGGKGRRVCTINLKEVKSIDRCKCWLMAETLKLAGRINN